MQVTLFARCVGDKKSLYQLVNLRISPAVVWVRGDLSTDLLRDEPIKDDYLAPDIQLQSVRSLKRVCHTCCDPDECMPPFQTELLETEPLPYCARRQ